MVRADAAHHVRLARIIAMMRDDALEMSASSRRMMRYDDAYG